MKKFADQGYMLVKIGDSHREADVRIKEQGGAAEYEAKIKISEWNNLTKIDRDYRIHEVLTERGLWHRDGQGTEWFKIPATNAAEVRDYVDQLITDLEGERVRPPAAQGLLLGSVERAESQVRTQQTAGGAAPLDGQNSPGRRPLAAPLLPRSGALQLREAGG